MSDERTGDRGAGDPVRDDPRDGVEGSLTFLLAVLTPFLSIDTEG
jgi:hypothetical protein